MCCCRGTGDTSVRTAPGPGRAQRYRTVRGETVPLLYRGVGSRRQLHVLRDQSAVLAVVAPGPRVPCRLRSQPAH